jgi:predicted Fe-Mo cluster-binding NifX family protein
MKIAVSTEAGNVAAHFGRCSAYTLFEVKDGNITSKEEIPNPGHQPGFLPRFLSQKGVDIIITGGMGPRAQNLFHQNNIQTIIGVQGPVDEIIDVYLKGELEPGEDLCDHSHGGGEIHGHRKEHSPRLSPELPVQGKNIGLTAKGPGLESEIDPNFGRASYFLIYNPDSGQIESFENPNREASQGAGIQSARFFTDRKIDVLLTGEVGPNAETVLKSAGIQIITGIRGHVGKAINSILKG